MLSDEEIEYRLIYAIIVAGKSASFVRNVMARLLKTNRPFQEIRKYIKQGKLAEKLREARTGNYSKIEIALKELVKLKVDLRSCSPEELEVVHGIGPKTSRFFILSVDEQRKVAALDVHVLRWLKGLGYDAPKATPSGKKYRELEKAFIDEADKLGITPAELDRRVWSAGAGYESAEEQWIW